MEHKTGYTAASIIGGSLAGSYESMKVLFEQPLNYTYRINWAETFQVCWKAGVGAIVGLCVKAIWDKIFKEKK